MASSIDSATATVLQLRVYIIKNTLKLGVYAYLLTKRIIIIMSSFYTVLLSHRSERCGLRKHENIIVLILHVWKLALESRFEVGGTLETLMASTEVLAVPLCFLQPSYQGLKVPAGL